MSSNKEILIKYAGMGAQLLAVIGVATFIGFWVDKKIGFHIPILVWLLPLLAIIGTIIKAIQDTSRKK